MASSVLILILVLLAAGLFLVYKIGDRPARDDWEAKEGRPEILRKARLAMSEEKILCDRPARLVGRVDQVYRVPSGELCIVDTKRRRHARVYGSDIAQISTYAAILRAHGHKVHPVGFVRQAWQDRVRYLPVRILPDSRVLDLVEKRRETIKNLGSAPLAAHPALCAGCGQREAGRCTGRA